MTNFNDLRFAIAARQLEIENSDAMTPAFNGLELAGELGEACNLVKKLERIRLGIHGAGTKPEEWDALREALAEELGDIIICTELLARPYGIELDKAVPRKFNKTSAKIGVKTQMAVPLSVVRT